MTDSRARPLLDLARSLYRESVQPGNGRLDMVSILAAIEARTEALARGGGPHR